MLKTKYIYRFSFFTAVVISYLSCESISHKEEESHSLLTHITEAHNDTLEYDVSTEETMEHVRKVMANTPEGALFLIPERHKLLKSFPCSNCHSQPLSELQSQRAPEERKAHWNIKLVHANEDVMNCATCHDQDNLDKLKSLTSKPILIDHSYKQCAQCHSKQYKEWVGGAHGKRLGGWAPPKVAFSCVNCHNPHQPAFDKRWPARLNTIKIQEQQKD